MSKTQTVLVPIRYPLTAYGIQTLEHANRLARSHDDAHLYVLHVNLFQNGSTAHKAEITAAITPFFDGRTPEVIEEGRDRRRDLGFMGGTAVLEEIYV